MKQLNGMSLYWYAHIFLVILLSMAGALISVWILEEPTLYTIPGGKMDYGEVIRGDSLIINRKICTDKTITVSITRQIIHKESNFNMTVTDGGGLIKAGCYHRSFSAILPSNIPLDHYGIDGVAIYKVNPLKVITWAIPGGYFKVI
jgi:hypothetical protein